MRSSTFRFLLISAAVLSLGACDKLGLPGGNLSETAGNSAAGKKLDGYIEAHNAFLDTFGFAEKAKRYRESDIAHSPVDGEFHVKTGTIEKGLTSLKTARAMSGGSPELDSAADALIASMTKVLTHLTSLEPYYDSKKYLDDKLARGKAEDAQMLAEFDAAEKDLLAFSKLIDAAIDKRDVVMLEKLKDSDPIQYQTKLAMTHAKKVINLFGQAKNPEDAKLLAQADAEIAIVEKAIADAKEQATKKNQEEPPSLDSLTQMIGYYRTFKERRETNNLGYMLSTYNQAIEVANRN